MQVLTIRIPKYMHKKIKSIAKRQGLTMNAFVINELWEAIRREGE